MELFIIGIISYLMGSIPFGLILTKIFLKKDIREIGSGNIGATNALRTGNKLIGYLTLILDVLKGVVPVLYVKINFPDAVYISALCAFITQQPVKIRLNRHNDMTASGKRHNFKVYFTAGFSSNAKINALDITLLSNGGNVLDLSGPVMTRALTHLDNCYSFKNFRAEGFICKTLKKFS